jgi:hypothetical protein
MHLTSTTGHCCCCCCSPSPSPSITTVTILITPKATDLPWEHRTCRHRPFIQVQGNIGGTLKPLLFNDQILSPKTLFLLMYLNPSDDALDVFCLQKKLLAFQSHTDYMLSLRIILAQSTLGVLHCVHPDEVIVTDPNLFSLLLAAGF